MTPRQFAEALAVVLKGLDGPTLDHQGEFYRFHNVPLTLEPVQRPHPPLWFGGHSVESAARAARQGGNYVTQDTAAAARPYTDEYRRVWAETRGAAPRPKLGLARFVVVADSDGEALRLARRAYASWHANFTSLYRRFNRAPAGERAADFDAIRHGGRGIAGSAAAVTEMLQAQVAEAGVDYVLCQFAFGDISLAEALRSVELFVTRVMPAMRG